MATFTEQQFVRNTQQCIFYVVPQLRDELYAVTEKPVRMNDVYEAFLRFDDNPMFLDVGTTDSVYK